MTKDNSKNRIFFSPYGNKRVFFSGIQAGIPIGLGYFAVSFALGIAAKNAGLSAFQGFLASLLTNASAGEYAVFKLMGENASYLAVALMTLIANARYLLMGCALGQRMHPSTPLMHRLIIGLDITDEVFGVTISRPGYINPYFTYGAMAASIPFWAGGTAMGIVMGNLLPIRVVSALSVALYGMFLAVIIPPTAKSRVIAALVPVSFALSFAFSRLPGLCEISSGTRTIILTVVIAGAAAVLFPVSAEEDAGE